MTTTLRTTVTVPLSWQTYCESASSSDDCQTVPSNCRPRQANRLWSWVCYQSYQPLPFSFISAKLNSNFTIPWKV